MNRLLTLALSAVLVLAAGTADAQRRDPLIGREVRVTAPNFADHQVRGTVTAFTHEGLRVQEQGTAEEHLFPVHSVERIDILKGRGRGATARARLRSYGFIGAALGAIAAPLVAREFDMSVGTGVAVFGGAGALLGGTAGVLSGNAAPREQWSWQTAPWGYDRNLKPSR